jgi:hypothetical protein
MMEPAEALASSGDDRGDWVVYLLVWQPPGRSATGPVHCPDAPPPLPALVGGFASANAGAALLTVMPTAKPTATSAFFMASLPRPAPVPHLGETQLWPDMPTVLAQLDIASEKI